MSRGLAIVTGGILLFVVPLTGASRGIDWRIRALVIAGALAGIAVIYYLDSRREKAVAKKAAEDDELRFRELSALADRPQFELPVTGSTGIGMAAVLTVSGALILLLFVGLFTQTFIGILLVSLLGAFLLGAGVFLSLRAIPGLGKPVMTISKSGLKSPLTPHLPWKVIDGIYLQSNTYHGEVISHFIILRIGTLPQIISQFAFF